MIRKVIIVVLTLLAVGAAALDWRSYSSVIRKQIRLTDQDLLFVHICDGFARLVWLYGEQDFVIGVQPRFGAGELLVPRTSNACTYPGLLIASPETMRKAGMSMHQIVWLQQWTNAPGGCPLMYRGFARTRMWAVYIMLALLSTLIFVCGPIRRLYRRRRGLCLRCGYNLEGNVSGVCPECGEAR